MCDLLPDLFVCLFRYQEKKEVGKNICIFRKSSLRTVCLRKDVRGKPIRSVKRFTSSDKNEFNRHVFLW